MPDSPAAKTHDAARAMDALRRIVHALHSANSRAEAAYRVSAAQLFVLRQIGAHPGITMSGIAERTRSAQSSVSEVVSRLVAQRLVDRAPSSRDGRRVELRLTAAGQDVARSARETIQERLVDAYERLEPRECATLATLMERWLDKAGLGAAPARFFFSGDGDAG
jgi:DNA-binding MarR family transcriptional regulator